MKLSLRRVKSVTEIVQQSKEREIDFKKLNLFVLILKYCSCTLPYFQ